MKILYLLDIPINSIGGSQKSTNTCIEIMQKNNHDVWLMCPQNEEEPISRENTLFFYQRKVRILSSVLKVLRTFWFIRQSNFDIVNAQNLESATIIGFLKKLGLIKKDTTTVFTDRGFLTAYTEQEIKRINWTIDGIDEVICTTHINQDNWNKYYPQKEAYCINNIVEEIWIEKENTDRNHETINIGFCGRFDEYKRWDTVEKIIDRLSGNELYSFFITLTYDNEMQRIHMNKFIEKIKKNTNVNIFINLSLDKMIQFYDTLDIFILTSEGESFGRTLIEAMLRNTIVIGTNSGGVPEVIEKKSNLFEVDDVNECINIIKKYNAHNIQNEKDYFYNFAKNKYSRENFENKLLQIYNTILEGR